MEGFQILKEAIKEKIRQFGNKYREDQKNEIMIEYNELLDEIKNGELKKLPGYYRNEYQLINS
mgnify:CR=1 FL=1